MKKSNRRRLRPAVDSLEDRVVLSTYGNAWPDPSHLTISFAQDGTRDGLSSSNLSQTLDGLNTGGNNWRVTLLRAFQTWEQYANVNLGLVSDGGQAFGAQGTIQGDSRFGDIRIGAVPQSSGTLALTQPLGYAAGTWAGDVNLNSSTTFGINDPNADDLFTVALHEAGHSLGLDDNSDPSSVMYGSYTGPRTTPSAADVAAIQAIYGARPADSGNSTFSSAANLVMINANGQNAGNPNTTIYSSLATPSSQDYYSLKTPGNNVGMLDIQLKAQGLSLLQATMTVYDHNHNVVATATAADPLQNDVTVSLSGQAANSNYYVSVKGATGDVFGDGDYMLRAIPRSVTSVASPPWSIYPATNGFNNLDSGTNDTLSAATSLHGRSSKLGANDYYYPGSLSTASDVDNYSFLTPKSIPAGTQDVMTVMVYGMVSMPVDAHVVVYNAAGQVVASNLIEHVGGSETIQVSNAPLNTTLYVKIAAYNSGNPTSIGNYGLFVSFGDSAEDQSQIAGGTLTQKGSATASFSSQAGASLTLDHDSLYNFNLAASNGGANQAVSVQMTITDAAGNVVATLQTRANQAQSLQVWLVAGSYTISFSGINNGISIASPLSYTLFTEDLSDPIKVYSSPTSGTTPTTR